MESAITAEIQADRNLHRTVVRANDVLVQTIGRSAEPPRAVWRLAPDGNARPIIELELLYHDEAVTRRFVPDELTDEVELQYRFGRLWEDLLVRANRRTTDRLLEILREWRHEAELQES